VYISWVLLRPSPYWYANCKSCLNWAWWIFGNMQKEIRDSSSCHETTYIEAENVVRYVCWNPLTPLHSFVGPLRGRRLRIVKSFVGYASEATTQ
jgi:hypothetical protein